MHKLAIIAFCLLLVGCSPTTRTSAGRANLCMTNMMAIYWEVRYWNFNGDTFPPSLASLAQTNPPPQFVCPCSGHTPGSMTNVEVWTDYIYLSGTYMDSMLLGDVATLICPPENHGGHFGHVVWGDGVIERLPADKIRALIKAPWCMPRAGRRSISISDGSGGHIPITEYLRTNTTLHVPERFRRLYPGWHHAYPTGQYPTAHYGRS